MIFPSLVFPGGTYLVGISVCRCESVDVGEGNVPGNLQVFPEKLFDPRPNVIILLTAVFYECS